MTQHPLVSSIVPVFKVEQYLERCVMSIINQTYQELEIILVDDGSPDKCGDICEELASKDNRIIVIHQQNMGLPKARRSGFNVSKGDYIYFLDSDDFIDTDAISNLVTYTKNNPVDMVVSGILIDGKTKYKRCQIIRTGYYNRNDIDNLLSSNFLFSKPHDRSAFPLYAWGKLISRDVMDGYFEVSTMFRYWEDVPATVFLMKKIRSMAITDIWHYYVDVWDYILKNDKEKLFQKQLPERIWSFCCSSLWLSTQKLSRKEFTETYNVVRQPDIVKQLVLDKNSIIQGPANNMFKFFMRNGWSTLHYMFLHYGILDIIKRIIK